MPVLDPRYGHMGNKSLGTRLHTAENGVLTNGVHTLANGRVELIQHTHAKSTDAMCFCHVQKLFNRSDIPTALFCHGQADRQTNRQTDRQTDRQTEAIA